MNRQSRFSGSAGEITASSSQINPIACAMALLVLSGCASYPQSPAISPSVIDRSVVDRSDTNKSILDAPTLSGDTAPYISQYQTPGTSTLSHDHIRHLFVEARAFVSKRTGADLDHIQLVFANDEQIGAEVQSETRRLISHQFTDARFASHFLNSVMSSQAGTYAALFATERAEVMLSTSLLSHYMGGLEDDLATKQAAIKALLIHELVHAADDVTYGIHENRTLNFRASFAQSATFEGHAQWMTRQICREAGCTSGLNALDNFMFGRDTTNTQLTQTVQAVSRNVLEYSYVEGEQFLAKLAARPNGDRLIKQLLSNPPQDPIQILDPASYPNIQRESRNQVLLKAAADVPHRWRGNPWAMVETSPLKGVNLRSEPGRRRAAIDGFTRLITSMVAAQLYNQQVPSQTPIEVTLMQTDHKNTASLFAETLLQNTVTQSSSLSNHSAAIDSNQLTREISVALNTDITADNQVFHSAVASLDEFVIQVSGVGSTAADFVEYSIDVLSNLTQNKNQSSL